MGWFDDAEVQRLRQEKERAESERILLEQRQKEAQEDLLSFTTEGLREFPLAAEALGLPPEKREIGQPGLAHPRMKPGWLLMISISDNSYLFRYWVDTDGGFWLDTQPSTLDKTASWIAKSCDYSHDCVRDALTAALAGAPLTKIC